MLNSTAIQTALAALKEKGWSLAAIADELQVSWVTAWRWKKGQMPVHVQLVAGAMDELLKKKRIPKMRRYIPGQRVRNQGGCKGNADQTETANQ
jgi:hypothetical protein